MPFETAVHQWAEGTRRLERADPAQRPLLERVAGAVEDELRRRLGGHYTVDELAELYDRGTTWASQIAMEVAPEDPYAWDTRVVVDSAFDRYLRGATDFGRTGRAESAS